MPAALEDSMENKRIPPCDYGDLLGRIGTQKTTWEYRNKEEIFSQGNAANAMFYIKSGHVKLTVTSKDGKKAVLAILGKGDFFGENCLLNNSRRTTTATALQRSTIDCVKKATLSGIIHREPAFSSLLVFDLLSRIGHIEEDFTDHLLNSSERRLARLLLRLSHFGQRSKAELAILHVSQKTLAEMVGTTRSRVSFFMNRFREMGLIKYNGTLQVHRALRTFLLHESLHPDGLMTAGVDADLVRTAVLGSTDKPVLALPDMQDAQDAVVEIGRGLKYGSESLELTRELDPPLVA
jgi:CRP/FNR family cyclic AMP-dependent transcriptional regulator